MWADSMTRDCDETIGSMISLWVKHDVVISIVQQWVCYLKCFQYSKHRSFARHSQFSFFFIYKNFSDISTMTDILHKYCKWTFFVQFNTLQKQTNNSCIV
jgi:hypothetical protein